MGGNEAEVTDSQLDNTSENVQIPQDVFFSNMIEA